LSSFHSVLQMAVRIAALCYIQHSGKTRVISPSKSEAQQGFCLGSWWVWARRAQSNLAWLEVSYGLLRINPVHFHGAFL